MPKIIQQVIVGGLMIGAVLLLRPQVEPWVAHLFAKAPSEAQLERKQKLEQLGRDWVEAQNWNGDETGLSQDKIAKLRRLRTMTTDEMFHAFTDNDGLVEAAGIKPQSVIGKTR